MKLITRYLTVGSIILAATVAQAADVPLKTPRDKVSYAVGVSIGKSLKDQTVDVNPVIVGAGIEDVIRGKRIRMTDEAMKTTLTNYQKELLAKSKASFEKLAVKNEKDGEAYMTRNAKMPGVQTLPSGLQYKVIKAGDGAKPKEGDFVTVNYEGRLTSGKVFDSSYKRGQPATFPVNGVIKGWTDALKMMRQGGTWEVVIPPKLAYGAQGVGGMIGPNQTLIFKINLIAIKPTTTTNQDTPV